MKYSILTMLGITAYLGVAFAAFARPLSLWNDISCGLWFFAVLWLVVESIDSKPHRAKCSQTILAYCLIYIVVSAALENNWVYTGIRPPHVVVHDAIWSRMTGTGPGFSGAEPYQEHLEDFEGTADPGGFLLVRERRASLEPALGRLGLVHTSLIFGLLGGCLMHWRQRRNERADRESL